MDAFFARLRGALRGDRRSTISVLSAQPDPYAAVPTLLLRLRIEAPEAEPVHAIVLKAQIRIEPQRRRYSPEEEERLLELFGEAPQWGESLRPFLWTHVTTTVAEFTGSHRGRPAGAVHVRLRGRGGQVPALARRRRDPARRCCSTAPSSASATAASIVQPIAWNVEAEHRLPVSVWRATMDTFFPNSGWIRLRRETIDALTRYKADRALTSWEDTVERLLKEAGP